MERPKPYFYIEDFPKLTPFSKDAIRTKVHRGELAQGRHYFRVGRRLVFKWDAIVAWIEKRPEQREGGDLSATGDHGPLPEDAIPLLRGGYLTTQGWHPGSREKRIPAT